MIMNKTFRMRIFNAACVSILLYGCETWTLTQKLEEKLNIFVRKLYRIMLNVKQAEAHMTNEELYKRAGQQPIAEEIRKRQLSFIGHILRMKPDEPANIYALYVSKVRSKNKTGRPPTSYIDQISTHLTHNKDHKLTPAEIAKYASDKAKWKSMIVASNKRAR
jgi:ribosomal 50S subunit-associated protein YjgA (DUF615 family)